MQMLSLTGHEARRWEPKRLRLRLFSIAGRLANHGRTRRLHLSAHAPWADLLTKMITTLQVIPAPG
jgi:Transposase DDE domain group 1